jgi:Na+/H+-translocating membrane pyrophosphatase
MLLVMALHQTVLLPAAADRVAVRLRLGCHWFLCRYLFVCVACGLWGGLIIGLQTEYFTSNRYRPVQVR